MAKVFITALGTGKYTPEVYTFEGRALERTRYVQRALLGAYGPTFFDRVVILLTPKAKEMHWSPPETLRDDLADVVAPDRLVVQDISERIEATAEQWSWFQAVLDHVGQGDDLYLDMTHGFRVVPIVLSAALNYLQAIKGVRLQAAFYGAHDAPGAPIVDFKDFYTLGPWADAVNRLVENADASKLATLAGSDSNLHFPEFNRPELIDALKALTDALKNIDVNAVASVAQRALGTLRESLARLDPSASAQRQMITLVLDKFAALSSEVPSTGRYDRDYFRVQSEIARLLLEHGFLMQAFTVLRELIGSIGLLGLSGTKYMSRQIDHRERASTRRYADVFVNMLQHPNWDFKGDTKEQAERLKPFFDHVVALDRTLYGTEDDFREAVRRLVDIRNGFDHAWTTTKPGARPYPDGITAFKGHGEAMRKRLLALVERLFDDDGSVVVVNPPPDADA